MLLIQQLTRLTGVLLLLSTSFSLLAAEQIKDRRKIDHQLPYLEAQIELDGNLSEQVWNQALKIALDYETSPAENQPAHVKTEVFLFENGETLFVGFNALDPNPEKIRDYLTDRDNLWNSDFVGIKFDTFGESRKAFQFFVNALGVQADATQEDFRGDDSSWDAIWESNGRLTESGYIVEMAIPFKALRFPDTGHQQSWGVEILRFVPRDVRHRIANAPVNRDISCRICQFDQLTGFSRIRPSKSLQLVPTLVVGRTESREDPINDPWQSGGIDKQAGIDFRWGITQDIVLNATINPDFSQVEADAAQLDVNRTFSIFVQEKRPFFLDGADYFTTFNRLVHTRDIIEPDYGLKVTGQTNSHSFGIFAVNDKHTSFLIPGNQSSELVQLENAESQNQVLRYSLDTGNKNNIGILATNRTGDDYSNRVIALDGKYWFDQNHSLSVQYMTSDSKYSDDIVNDYSLVNTKNLSDNAYTINLNHNSRNWWGYINHQEFGKDFRADLGFLTKVDFNKSVVGLGHRWFPQQQNSWWTEIAIGGDWDITHDISGLELEEETELKLELQGAYQSFYKLGMGKRNRYFDDNLEDSLQGEYFDEKFIFVRASLTPIEALNLRTLFEWSDAIDFSNSRLGKSFRASPGITWQHGQHLNTKLEYTHVDFDVDDGDLFDAAIVNIRVNYQLDTRSSIRFTLQELAVDRYPELYTDDVDKQFKSRSSQLLYSYKVNPQTLFFAGYSDRGFQDDQLSTIEKTGKSLFMKYSYAWQI